MQLLAALRWGVDVLLKTILPGLRGIKVCDVQDKVEQAERATIKAEQNADALKTQSKASVQIFLSLDRTFARTNLLRIAEHVLDPILVVKAKCPLAVCFKQLTSCLPYFLTLSRGAV